MDWRSLCRIAAIFLEGIAAFWEVMMFAAAPLLTPRVTGELVIVVPMDEWIFCTALGASLILWMIDILQTLTSE